VTDAQVPDTITITLAATATALAANGGNCAAGQAAAGVDASGVAEGCAVYVTSVSGTAEEITSSGGATPVISLPAILNLGGKTLKGASPLLFDGLTADTFKTTLAVTDPTAARVFTLPNADSVAVQPDAGAANNLLTAISALGVISKAQPAFSNLSGSATDAQIPDTITITLAATATALAANPTDCAANQFAISIVASGNLTCAAIVDADVPDTITASNYLLLAGGTLTGNVTAPAFISAAADPADLGVLRLGLNEVIAWETGVNDARIEATSGTGDVLTVHNGAAGLGNLHIFTDFGEMRFGQKADLECGDTLGFFGLYVHDNMSSSWAPGCASVHQSAFRGMKVFRSTAGNSFGQSGMHAVAGVGTTGTQAGFSDTVAALKATPHFAAGAGHSASMVGVYVDMTTGQLSTSDGTLTEFTGVLVDHTINLATTVTDMYGLRVDAFAGDASFSNLYGFKIGKQSGATNNWGGLIHMGQGALGLQIENPDTPADNSVLDAPTLRLTGSYDSDAGAGITRTVRHADIVHNVTATTPASQFDFSIGGTLRGSLTDAGAWEAAVGFQITGNTTSGRFLRHNGTRYVQSSGVASGAGACTSQFVRTLNDDAAPTCASVSLSTDVTGTLADGSLSANVVLENQANTYTGGGLQDLSAMKLALPAATTLPATCTANKEIYVDTDATPAGQQVYLCNSAGTGWNLIGDGGAGGTNHNLLSATHTDTVSGTVLRGDLVVGQTATPTWQRLALGASATFLRSNATDALWAAIADADVPDTITASNYLLLAGGTLTGTVTLRAGAAGAGTAPAKFQAGAVNTTAEAHAFEWDGTNLFVTQSTGPTRKQLVYTSLAISTTAPLGGGGDLSANRTLTCTTCTTNAAALTVDQVVVGAAGQAVKILAAGGAATVLTMSGGIPTWAAPGGGTSHAILSATHTDSLAAAVVLGDLIHGNGTPAWARLVGNITTTKQFLNQTGTGAISALPVWSALVDADVPDTITLTNLTQITTRAISDTTGTLLEPRGGTGESTYTLGDILYSDVANSLAKLAGNITTAKQFLTQTGTGAVSAAPAWAAIADADVPDSITITLAATATALAANPTDCAANQFAISIVASGNLTCAAIADADIPAAIMRDAELAAFTVTKTNLTLDVEATGNVITTVSYVTFMAATCQNATATLNFDTPTTSPAVAACITGTNTQKGVADFADAVNLSMQTTFPLPRDWSGTVDARFKWLTTATANSVVWQLSTICVADAETDDPAFNTASTVTDAAKGTANQTNDADIAGVTMTGCAAGALLHLKVQRDSAHASDTLAATARLISLELTLRRAQ